MPRPPRRRPGATAPAAKRGRRSGAARERQRREADERQQAGGEARPSPRARGIALELGEELVHRGPALVGIDRQPAHDDAAEPDGQVALRGRRLDAAREDARRDRLDRVAAERRGAGERAIERGAEAELIGPGVDRASRELLGRHEERRAEVAEVHDADRAVARDHDVGGLEVAMDEVRGVGGGEPARGAREDGEDLRPRARARGEPILQRDAVDELRGDEDVRPEIAGVVHGDDGAVRELGEGLGLEQQLRPRAIGVGAAARLQELERDLAIEQRIKSREDAPHGAAAHEREDRVAADGRSAGQAAFGRARRRRRIAAQGAHASMMQDEPVEVKTWTSDVTPPRFVPGPSCRTLRCSVPPPRRRRAARRAPATPPSARATSSGPSRRRRRAAS